MNPLSPNGRRTRVRREVARIRAAWPTATVTRGIDEMHATVVIHEPASTYVIEVEPDSTRSLHVRHDIALPYAAQWQDGWDD